MPSRPEAGHYPHNCSSPSVSSCYPLESNQRGIDSPPGHVLSKRFMAESEVDYSIGMLSTLHSGRSRSKRSRTGSGGAIDSLTPDADNGVSFSVARRTRRHTSGASNSHSNRNSFSHQRDIVSPITFPTVHEIPLGRMKGSLGSEASTTACLLDHLESSRPNPVDVTGLGLPVVSATPDEACGEVSCSSQLARLESLGEEDNSLASSVFSEQPLMMINADASVVASSTDSIDHSIGKHVCFKTDKAANDVGSKYNDCTTDAEDEVDHNADMCRGTEVEQHCMSALSLNIKHSQRPAEVTDESGVLLMEDEVLNVTAAVTPATTANDDAGSTEGEEDMEVGKPTDQEEEEEVNKGPARLSSCAKPDPERSVSDVGPLGPNSCYRSAPSLSTADSSGNIEICGALSCALNDTFALSPRSPVCLHSPPSAQACPRQDRLSNKSHKKHYSISCTGRDVVTDIVSCKRDLIKRNNLIHSAGVKLSDMEFCAKKSPCCATSNPSLCYSSDEQLEPPNSRLNGVLTTLSSYPSSVSLASVSFENGSSVVNGNGPNSKNMPAIADEMISQGHSSDSCVNISSMEASGSMDRRREMILNLGTTSGPVSVSLDPVIVSESSTPALATTPSSPFLNEHYPSFPPQHAVPVTTAPSQFIAAASSLVNESKPIMDTYDGAPIRITVTCDATSQERDIPRHSVRSSHAHQSNISSHRLRSGSLHLRLRGQEDFNAIDKRADSSSPASDSTESTLKSHSSSLAINAIISPPSSRPLNEKLSSSISTSIADSRSDCLADEVKAGLTTGLMPSLSPAIERKIYPLRSRLRRESLRRELQAAQTAPKRFDQMPTEVLLRIVHYLSIQDLFRIQRVNKRFKSIIERYLLLVKRINFSNGLPFAFLPDALDDAAMKRILSRTPEVTHILGFYPRHICGSYPVDSRYLGGRPGCSGPLSYVGIIEAFRSCTKLRSVELMDVELMSKLVHYLPRVKFHGMFRNRPDSWDSEYAVPMPSEGGGPCCIDPTFSESPLPTPDGSTSGGSLLATAAAPGQLPSSQNRLAPTSLFGCYVSTLFSTVSAATAATSTRPTAMAGTESSSWSPQATGHSFGLAGHAFNSSISFPPFSTSSSSHSTVISASLAQAAAAFAHRAAVKASRLADWFEPVGEAPLGQGAPSTTSPHFLPPHVPRIFNLGVGAPVAPGLGPGPVGQHHIRHAAALPGPPMPPQQQAHHLVAGPPAVPLEAAEVLLHDPGLHHQLAPPPVFPGPGAAPVHAQLPVNPIAGPVAALAFFPPVRPAPLQLGMAAGVLPPRRQVGPIQAGVAELPHAQGGGRRRGASPPLPAQPALAIAGGLGQNLAGPLAPVPGQLPQLQVRPQALQQHANIVRNLPAAAAVHMVQNPHHHHHHNQQHEQYLNHHYIQHNQHQGQAQHHNHHSDASRAAVAISGSGLVSPLPSLYHWISLPQSITNLTKLDLVCIAINSIPRLDNIKYLHLKWVHFTVADPFVNFTAPKLQSFVMNNCVGLQRSMRFMRLFYALARAPQLARLELVAARFIDGLLESIVDDGFVPARSFRNLQRLVLAGNKEASEMDVGLLLVAGQQTLGHVGLQIWHTRNSLFDALARANIRFPRLESLVMGYQDPYQSRLTASELAALELVDSSDSLMPVCTITDRGMSVAFRLCPRLTSLTVRHAPYLVSLRRWQPSPSTPASMPPVIMVAPLSPSSGAARVPENSIRHSPIRDAPEPSASASPQPSASSLEASSGPSSVCRSSQALFAIQQPLSSIDSAAADPVASGAVSIPLGNSLSVANNGAQIRGFQSPALIAAGETGFLPLRSLTLENCPGIQIEALILEALAANT